MAVLAICAALACDDKSTDAQVDSSAPTFSIVEACLDTADQYGFVPLAPGNRWLYRFQQFDDSGNVDSSGPDMLVQVVGTTTYGGVEWFRLQTTYGTGDSGGEKYERLVRNCPDGYCENGKMMFKDVTPGSRYYYQGMSVTLSDSIYRGSAPSGGYRCRRFEMYDQTTGLNWYFYVQQGIGRVKTEVVRINPERVFRSFTLISYKAD